ncbi:MAG TPA: tetratricopeptide repeat protein, partial [Tepidisphaeraceae bacterium]|nr:tetratricopeptide repeat protein [Tepidisphaeraceae bacterium]
MAKKKKKRNLNIPFLIVVVLVALGIVGGTGALIYKKQDSKNVAIYKESARVAIEAGDWEKAYEDLTHDPHHMGRDPEAMMWLYDVSMHLTSYDKEKFDMAKRAIYTVVQLNPRSLPAHEAQLKLMRDWSELMIPNADLLATIEEIANQVKGLAPESLDAIEALAFVKTQRMRLSNSTADSGEFKIVGDDLLKQCEAHPESTELAFAYLSARLGEATSMRREMVAFKMPQELKDLLQAIEDTLNVQLARAEDPKTRSHDRTLIYSKSLEVYSVLADLWSEDEGQRKKYSLRASEMLPLIIDTADPEDEDFERMVGAAGAWSEFTGNIPQAERAYRRVLEGRPESWRGRIDLANLLYRRAGGLDSAIELLEVDLPPSPKLYGLKGRLFFDNTVDAQLQRAFLRSQKLPSLQGEERTKLRELIESDLAKATAQGSESDPRALRVRGGLTAMDGEYRASMQLFNRALEKIPAGANDPRTQEMRNQIKLQMYTVMLADGQTGSARSLLEDVLKTNNSPILRLQLAQLFLREKQFPEAREQLEAVLKVEPDNAAARTLLLQTEDPKAQKEAYAKLPEDTAEARGAKFNAAARAQNVEEVIRLGELVHKDRPGDAQFAIVISDIYVRLNRKADALRIIDETLAVNPNDANLKVRRQVVTADNPEDRKKAIEDALATMAPVERLIVESQLAMRAGDDEKYVKLLTEAAELDDKAAKPSGMAAERLFAYYAQRGVKDNAEYAKANQWLDRLKKYNYDQAQGRILQGRLMLTQSTPEAPRYVEVMDLARGLISEMPDFAQPWVLLALAQQANGQLIDALSSFNEALKKQPDNLEALRGSVTINEQLNRIADARPLVERALLKDPNDVFFLDKKLTFDLFYGDATPVIRSREESVRQFPKNPQNRLRLAQAYEINALRFSSAGDAVKAKEQWGLSRDTYADAMKEFPGQLEFVDGYARMSGAAGDFEAGKNIYAAVRVRPETAADPLFTLRFAEYLGLGGAKAEAVTLLEDFLKNQKDDAGIRLRLAQLYVQA